jgi:iron complex outermembrane receptor protein
MATNVPLLRAERRQARNRANGGLYLVLWLLFALVLALQTPRLHAEDANDTQLYSISAAQLSAALLEFSRQSGRPIVFSSRLTRNIPAPPLKGEMTYTEALNVLLNGSRLSWKLIDKRIFAIYETRCDTPSPDQACPSYDETYSQLPLFVPGIEETWIYGTKTTGSRIHHSSQNDSAPVDVISAPDIDISGAQTLGELLKFVPAVAGNSASTAISNGGDGTATVTLRGLPSSNTLVLINGRRVVNDGLAGESVDLNSIPPAAVERIEILKNGASAIYGSDAIAGVVNIIMKRDFHGLLLDAFYGETSRGDLETQTQTFQYGTGIPNGSFFISASHYEQKAIFSRDRKVSKNADTRPLGGTDQRSSATPASRITLPNGSVVIPDAGQFRPASEQDLFNYQAFTTAVVPLTRNNLYANISYDFSEQVTGRLGVGYSGTEAESILAPTPIFTAFEQLPLTVSANSDFNPFGSDIADVRRRLLEFPERTQKNTSDTRTISATIEGLYDTWDWDINYNWSYANASQRTQNIVNAENLARGLGPAESCRGTAIDGCTAINLFGPPGSISREQVGYISADGEVSGYSKLSAISFNVSNELMLLRHGSADLALGLEYRQESTSKRPDQLLAKVGTLGASNFQTTSGERKVMEMYGELAFPLWKSSNGFYSTDFDAAIRYSDYSDFGGTTNPKVGLRVQLGPSLLVRSTYAYGFRAPTLNELYEGETEDQAFLSDPCTLQANVGVLAGCQLLADPTRNQFLTVKGGNPDLDAETSRSLSLGFVWMPARAAGLRVSADYFLINQDDVVASSAQFIVNQNAQKGVFDDSIKRDEQGNLRQVSARNVNVGHRQVQGVDFALSYHHSRRTWGQLSFTSSATYIAQLLTKLDATDTEIDLAGTFRDEASDGLGGIPHWKGQLGLRWSGQRWRGNYEVNFISSLEETIPGSSQTRDIDSWTVHDVQLSYEFNVFDGLRWSLGVDNLMDEDAPLAVSAFNDNIDGRTHDLKGRYWYSKLSQRF